MIVLVTIEEKLHLFEKILYDKTNSKINDKLTKAREEINREIAKEEKAVQAYKEKITKEIYKKHKGNYEKELFKAKFEAEQELINLREELIKETVDGIKANLIQFINSKDYEEYIFSNIDNTLKNIKNENSLVIYFNNEDLKRFKERLEKEGLADNVQISSESKNILGGYILEAENMRFRIDCSLDSSIEECIEKVGIKITEILV